MLVLTGVLSAEELALIRQALDLAEFEDGKLTAGLAAPLKDNRQLRRTGAAEEAALDGAIAAALARHTLFTAAARPRHITAPLYARYEPGMHYGAHVDAAVMGLGGTVRADVSVTVFLNDPSEYEGGELAVELPGGVRQVKLAAGDAVAYSTFSVHQVNPVTAGRRLVAVLWAQSRVRDPQMREVLFDLHAAGEALHATHPESLEDRLVHKATSNLLRLVTE